MYIVIERVDDTGKYTPISNKIHKYYSDAERELKYYFSKIDINCLELACKNTRIAKLELEY